MNSVETSSCSRDDKGDLGSQVDELGSSDELVEAPAASIRPGISERTCRIDQSCSGNSSCLVDMAVLETVIVVNLDQTACVSGGNKEAEVKSDELGTTSNPLVEKRKVSKVEKEDCAIDMNCGAGDGKGFKESLDEERVCRICQLSSEQASETASDTSVSPTTMELIQLGCGCKNELGIAHNNCAEVWFKLKGNRTCEICGQTAKNITGIGNNRFMAAWNEQRISGGNRPERQGGCWRGQPFCNFLMACLVMAFVLPWFFNVNML